MLYSQCSLLPHRLTLRVQIRIYPNRRVSDRTVCALKRQLCCRFYSIVFLRHLPLPLFPHLPFEPEHPAAEDAAVPDPGLCAKGCIVDAFDFGVLAKLIVNAPEEGSIEAKGDLGGRAAMHLDCGLHGVDQYLEL